MTTQSHWLTPVFLKLRDLSLKITIARRSRTQLLYVNWANQMALSMVMALKVRAGEFWPALHYYFDIMIFSRLTRPVWSLL
jgi:hypothetical protein